MSGRWHELGQITLRDLQGLRSVSEASPDQVLTAFRERLFARLHEVYGGDDRVQLGQAYLERRMALIFQVWLPDDLPAPDGAKLLSQAQESP